MNASEFKTWWADYSKRFPDTLAWLNATANPVATLAIWREVFADVELADALEANKRMLSGDAEPVKAFERESTPRIVRAVALKVASERRNAQYGGDDSPSEFERSMYGAKADFSLGGLYRKILELTDRGAIPQQAIAALEQSGDMPPQDDRGGKRLACVLCEDGGLVTVWSGRTVRACLEHGEAVFQQAGLLLVMLCPCSCGVGLRRIGSPADRGKRKTGTWTNRDVCYREERYALCERGDVDSSRNRTALRLFCERKQAARLERFERYAEVGYTNHSDGEGIF